MREGTRLPAAPSSVRMSVHLSMLPLQIFACSPTVLVPSATTKMTGRPHLFLFFQFWLRPGRWGVLLAAVAGGYPGSALLKV